MGLMGRLLLCSDCATSLGFFAFWEPVMGVTPEAYCPDCMYRMYPNEYHEDIRRTWLRDVGHKY